MNPLQAELNRWLLSALFSATLVAGTCALVWAVHRSRNIFVQHCSLCLLLFISTYFFIMAFRQSGWIVAAGVCQVGLCLAYCVRRISRLEQRALVLVAAAFSIAGASSVACYLLAMGRGVA